MTFSQTLTILAPALILSFLWLVTKLSPPSREGTSSRGPEWWRRDQKTWDEAQRFTTKKYGLYASILAAFCLAALFFEWEYSSLIGYGLLILLFLLAQYQVRRYMEDEVK